MGKKLTTQEVIEKCLNIHGLKYDYTKIDYKNSASKISIVCPEHGEFKQRFHDHIKGGGCPYCSGNGKLNTDMFIKKANIVHGNKYDYSIVEYKNTELRINIICKLHGKFSQTPHDHLSGKGCNECGRQSTTNSHLNNTEIFIKKSQEIHGNRYMYLDEYKNQHEKIEIICQLHGTFLQKPKYHLQGNGCPICKESKGEKEIRKFLNENNIEYKSQYSFSDCKNINKLTFDFYLPNKNICIEYDGRQHFESIENWGGDKAFLDIQKRDRVKNEYCKINGINLLRIKYSENVFEVLEKSHIFTK